MSLPAKKKKTHKVFSETKLLKIKCFPNTAKVIQHILTKKMGICK